MFRGCYIILSVCSALVIVSHAHTTHAQSPWLSSTAPYVTDHGESPLPTYTNKPCVPNITFITRSTDLPHGQLKQTHEACAIRTAYGIQNAANNEVIPLDSTVAATIVTNDGSNLSLIAIPNSPDAMYQVGGLDGTNRYLIRNIKDSTNVVKLPDGSHQLKLHPAVATEPITDSHGVLLPFSDTRFSDNGKWMIGDVPNVGMTRVNTETRQTLTFGPALSYSIGINPRFVMAISSNGRYAAFSDSSHEMFRLYDLSTCLPDKPASCQWRDILPLARSRIPNFNVTLSMEFSTDTTLRFIASHRRYTITAGGEFESLLDYLATGDSFASGEGAYRYKPGTDIQEPFNKCHLSLVSYPYLLTGKINVNTTESVACSGARIKDFYEPQIHTNTSGHEAYRDFLTGNRAQKNFVDSAKPKIITTSIGGNDIGFGRIIASCVAPGTCFDTDQQRADLAATIESKFTDLAFLYTQLKQSAATNAHVYVIGYPELVDPAGNCANNVHLDTRELTFANQLVHFINNVIERAANASSVQYINITDVFAGHRLCETKSSDVAVNGLTAGDDKTFTIPIYGTDYRADYYFTGQESYHPNQLGHQLLADLIARHINNDAAQIRSEADIFSVNPALEPHRVINDEQINPIVITKSRSTAVAAAGFAPLTPVTMFLYNSGTIIDASSTNQQGIATSVPNALPIGLQIMSFVGKNTMGETIQVQKQIYIAVSENDIDGDGIPNAHESCLFVSPSNQDIDQDDIDDACDGYISEPPIKASVPNSIIRLTLAVVAPGTDIRQENPHQPTSAMNDFVLNRQVTRIVATVYDEVNGKRPLYLVIAALLTTLTLILLITWWRKRT